MTPSFLQQLTALNAACPRRVPALVVTGAAPAAQADALWLCVLTDRPDTVAAEALNWSSRVSIEPDAVLLEVAGSRRLFGSLAALRTEIERVFAVRQWLLQLALAPTPRAALWLARGAPGAWVESPAALHSVLGAVPLRALNLPPTLMTQLHGFGVRRVRDVARLPRAALARRAGPALNDVLARAFGDRPDPRVAWQPPPRFHARRELGFETESTEFVAKAVEPLFMQLESLLRVSDRAVRRCTLLLEHADHAPTRLRIGVLEPVRDTQRLQQQLVLHLEKVKLRAPIRTVSLHAARLERIAGASRDLFAPDGSGEGWLALLERLQTRLGADALYGLELHDDHRPERAFIRKTGAAPWERRSWRRDSNIRPLWLLAEPRPAQPARYRIASGPERIESGWWDGADVARDYFVARDRYGARCWVFQERRPPYGWYLHGLFG
ncbi:MAG: DNA polymerase Y family protein [Gammaproteobacteria bacterium]